MTQTLEAQLSALCEQHGLTGFSLHVSIADGEPLLYAHAHRDGKCSVSSSYRSQTFAEAASTALAALPGRVTDLAPMEGLAA